MVFICIRCKYQTDHKNYIENHLNKKNKCNMNYFLLLNIDDQIKLSSISFYNNPEHIKIYNEYINILLKKGFDNILDFEQKYQNLINDKYEKIESLREEKNIKKTFKICLHCGFFFENRSNLTRHSKNNRCFMKKIKDNILLTISNNDLIFNNNISYDDINIFENLQKGYVYFIRYKLKYDKIENNLFYIDFLNDNNIIIIENYKFKKVNRIIIFEKWLNQTMIEIENLFSKIHLLFEWNVLKNTYQNIKDEYNNYINQTIDSQNNNILLNDWSKTIYENNNLLFINYIKKNKNLFDDFEIY